MSSVKVFKHSVGKGDVEDYGTSFLCVVLFIFNIFHDKIYKNYSQLSGKPSSFLHFVNVSFNDGNCLGNSFNIHIGTNSCCSRWGRCHPVRWFQ